MRKYKYTGIFKSADNHQFQLEVYCNGFIQALILLTADAIRMGNHYQLDTITNQEGDSRKVDDIGRVGELLS